MDEFRWIQMFLCLMIQIAVSVNETSIFMKVGDDVTLLCLNVIDEQNNCDGTTWIFTSTNKPTTVELITLGQIGEEAKTQSDRLSVTANCSLLIKKLTVEDVGLYYCQQYKVKETPSQHTLVHQSFVHVAVITLTEHKDIDKGTLNCSVLTHGECHQTVMWQIKDSSVSLRSIIVSVGLAATLITAVSVNIWTRTKGNTTKMDKTIHYDQDEDDVTINYENIGVSAASVRFN
ncbi:uncharacterized protein LOC102299779 isoform X6 [Haplochromis burtoni]|uniref:uncharacterized protein LOC102299779 isoform X6 n=1 Tax=Haplochromis burtoni TaxID=8153 RepID=UPI001C2DDFCD|nr:uncharacterized protein LOC102299779 isoform X6 [Haplochromis burtoni]